MRRFLLLAPLLAATTLALPPGVASAQTAYVTPGYVAGPSYGMPAPAYAAPPAIVVPGVAAPRIDYVAPPGVAIYDVPTTYGGTITMAAPGW